MTPNDPNRGDLPPIVDSARVIDPWNWPPDAGWSSQHNLIGYQVKATDGTVGKIDMATHAQDASYLVVDAGRWIFGSTLVVPAGLVSVIDHSEHTVYLICNKELVKSAPPFKPLDGKFTNRSDGDQLAGYYRKALSR